MVPKPAVAVTPVGADGGEVAGCVVAENVPVVPPIVSVKDVVVPCVLALVILTDTA